MNLNFEQDAQNSLNRFSRLGTWYILALCVIATISIVGQILIQDHVTEQFTDSRVINVAGKQRMLSQKITKTILLLSTTQEKSERVKLDGTLQSTLALWKLSQGGLLHGNDSLNLIGQNSDTVNSIFEPVTKHFDSMYISSKNIADAVKVTPTIPYDSLQRDVKIILAHEGSFLKGMDKIVLQYDFEARERVTMLSKLEYVLLIISLFVILMEILFVFRPTTAQVNQTMNRLVSSEKNAQKLTKEIGALYASLESSYEKLSYINQPAENPKLYAKADKGGNVFFISDLFAEITNRKIETQEIQVAELFDRLENRDDMMDAIIDLVSNGEIWQGALQFTDYKKSERWADVVVIPVYNEREEIEELQVFGSDITKQKYAEQNMHLKSRAEIDKKINEQKFRSVLILEGQEEERKRIAMDIHDGIGQQLTSLKFQIESVDMKNVQATETKINEIKQGIKDVIKEVRRVTFNLKPTVLGDYGMQAALSVFIREISKLTDINLLYKTEGDISFRLPQKVENNIFRIVQEAINNAIKYSGASRIEVLLKQTENNVVITINDEGKGFDEKIVEARSVNIESGRGFFNMYERTEYINGHLEIKSAPGEGTIVTLSVPLRNAVTVV